MAIFSGLNVDVVITRDNPIAPVLLHAQNERGEQWLADRLQMESWQKFGNTVCIDRRFLDAIFDGMADDGITTNLERSE